MSKKRTLPPEEEKIVREFYSRKENHKSPNGYVTLTNNYQYRDFKGYKGQTLKIVMVSRFGDMGLTADLTKEYGYEVRINIESHLLSNIRLEKE